MQVTRNSDKSYHTTQNLNPLDSNSANERERTAQKASLSFERLMCEQMLNSMQGSLENGFFEQKGTSAGWYESMFNQVMAAEITGSNGIGLAKLIYEQSTGKEWQDMPQEFRLQAILESGSPDFSSRMARYETEVRDTKHGTLAKWNPPTAERKSELQNFLTRSAKEIGLDPSWASALAKTESAWDEFAVSKAGARGVMQIMPATARDLGLENSFDAFENIKAGLKYLKSLLDKFDGDHKLAAAAYNAGPGAVEKYNGIPPFSETIQYVKRIEQLFKETNHDRK
jgi:Rod binding domain-containing protein